MDDPRDFSPRPGARALELPAPVKIIENCDGRIMATLADGRVIDATDWFDDGAPRQ